MTRDGIGYLTGEITRLGCRVFPTQANFFLVDVGCDCKDLYERLLHLGVIIRPMAAYGYPSYIRITVGIEAENRRLVQALSQVLTAMRAE